jgi:hypothetical protein
MAQILFLDSFDHYTTADLGKKWDATGSGTVSAGNGRNGTASMRMPGNAGGPVKNVPNMQTVFAGFAFRMNGTPPGGGFTIYVLNDGGTNQASLNVNGSGFLEVRRGITTVLATAATNALSAGTYYYIEARFTLHSSFGVAEVHVNGTTVINATGLNTIVTANAYATSVSLSCGGTGAPGTDFDDFYLATDAFCGDCRVIALLPQGAGNYSQWTPSAGLGYQCVDEAAMNSDTDYVSSATPGQRNSYDFTSVGATGVIKAVQHVTAVRKDDAGARTIKQFARAGGTDYDGSAVSVPDTYAMQTRVLVTNPATGTDWTVSAVDSSEFGCKLEA